LLIRVAHLDPIPSSCRAGRPSGFRSINHHTGPKAGNLLCNGDQPVAQPAIPDSYVYHTIATKDGAHLCCGQHDPNRQIAPQGAGLPAPAFRPIEREEEQRGFAGSYGFADFLEAGNRKASSARQTDRVQTTLYQQRLDAIRKPCRRYYSPARRTREQPSRYGALQDIPTRG
jgi:hypothetical protein